MRYLPHLSSLVSARVLNNMVKNSLLWLYRVTLFTLWLTIIVLASAVLSMRYLVLPNIDSYKEEIAQRISATMNQKVVINRIEASWDGLNPRLSLRNVEVYDKQDRPALTLGHVATSLSWLSIPLMEPRLSRLTIFEPALTIRRETDGTLYVAGIAMGGDGDSGFADWLLRQSQIDVVDATVLWQDDLRKAPPLTLDHLHLRVLSPAWESLIGHHRFGLQATPSAGSSQPIDIRGDVYGKSTSDWSRWRGTVYAKLEGTDIAAWRNWVSYPFDLREGFGAAQLWLDFAGGKAQKLTADVVLRNVVTRLTESSPEALLERLTGRLAWLRLPDGQKIQAENIRIATADGLNMQDGNGSFTRRTINGKQWMEGTAELDEIQLQSLMAFAAYFPVPEKTLQQLNEISPTGKLQQLKLGWRGDQALPDDYSIESRFSGLGMQPYQHIPGFSNLSGKINANETGGSLTLDTQQAVLDFRHVMRMPLPADKIAGLLRWTRNGKRTEIRTSNLDIANAHLAGTLNGRYVHDGGPEGGYLDLNAHLNRADASFAQYYYPLILGDKTLAWLDSAIIAGHSEDVDVAVKGKLKDFPFPGDKQGLFKVSARISDGVLAFDDEWPQLEKLNLDLLFQGERMEINAESGSTLGNRIIKAQVVIPALNAEDPVLQVSGDAQGTVAEGIRYVNSSPLAELAGDFTQRLEVAGNGKLHLELALPIRHSTDTRVKGQYTVTDGSLAGPNLPQLTRINGALGFTENGLRAQNIKAWLYGGPLQFNLLSKEGQVLITARGRVTDTGLAEAFGSRLTERIAGSADWSGTIRIEKGQTNIAINSTLEGMASSLPEPLGKIPATPMPLTIERAQQSAEQDIIAVSLADTLHARLLRNERDGALQVERGEIGVNVIPEIPSRDGIAVRGKLQRLDLDEWRNLLESSTAGTTTAGTGDASKNFDLAINRVDLDIDVLDVFDRRINDLKLHADAANDNWRMEIQSREITGTAEWLSQGDGKIIAKLQKLIVPGAVPGTAELRTQGGFKQQVRDYPALDIVAEQFELGKKKLGRLELQASEQGDNWSIKKLRISNPDSVLTGDGEWRNWKRRPNTRMNLAWEISDIGKTLERFGYPGIIRNGKANLNGQLKWLGSPQQFQVQGLAGNLKLDASEGQILQIKPGVGRLFSVLSLQNLPRRLTFDFRDVFSRGFAFDTVSATVDIDNGIMRSDDFRMEGPAALVEIKGQTNLAKETQHLFVKVTPYISDSLALAALAGGPVVGAAAYITQKLLKDPLNEIVAREYEITGSWDDPVVEKERNKGTAPAPAPLSDGVNQ
jgi:uncharacterized protein (TIGR02099 family)